jgi:hypothetical protein
MAYKAHVLKLHTDIMGSAVLIGGVLRQSATHRSRVVADTVAGSQYPLHASINEIKSGFTFQSYSLKQVIDAIGFAGLSLLSATNPGLELYEILYTDQGQIASGSVHRKLAIRNGRAVIRRLTCQHRQDAMIEVEAFAISSDGVAAPIAITETVASPGTATDPVRHTISSVQFAAKDLGCVQSVELDFGINIESSGCKSNIYDTQVDVPSIQPSIMVTTKKVDIFSSTNIPITGLEATQANTFVKLRKRVKNTGTFVADATAEHIVINAAGIVEVPNPFDGSNNEDATAQVKLTALFDGTNVPFVINTASAL